MDSGQPRYDGADTLLGDIEFLITKEKEESFAAGRNSGFHLRLKLEEIKLELALYDHDKEKLFLYHRSISWIFGDLDDYNYILINYKHDSDILNKIKVYRKYD